MQWINSQIQHHLIQYVPARKLRADALFAKLSYSSRARVLRQPKVRVKSVRTYNARRERLVWFSVNHSGGSASYGPARTNGWKEVDDGLSSVDEALRVMAATIKNRIPGQKARARCPRFVKKAHL
jgi:hypothetical protein